MTDRAFDRDRNTSIKYYLYENGIELDFLTEDNILIEAKYNPELRGEQLKAFNSYPAKRKYLIDSVKGLSVLDELFESGSN